MDKLKCTQWKYSRESTNILVFFLDNINNIIIEGPKKKNLKIKLPPIKC